MVLYAASTLYHAITVPRAKRVLKRVDHAAIYLLIAGTYTPFILVTMRTGTGWLLFGAIWALATAGILTKLWFRHRYPKLSMISYLVMGWLVVLAAPEVARAVRDDMIMATGRSDYPNQVNNVLGFPFIFRGALDVRASKINEEMKLAAAHALADLARELAPEIVAMDLRMPRMDGLEVLEAISGELDQVPVIVVTGAGVLQDAVAALRLGAFDFVTKPIVDMAVLEHAVLRALERNRLKEENRRYQAHLEDEIRIRTRDLHRRTEELEVANADLQNEMEIREKTAAALKQSESRLAEMVSIFQGFIYTCDANFRLEFVNRTLAQHVGADVTGRPCHLALYGQTQTCRPSMPSKAATR